LKPDGIDYTRAFASQALDLVVSHFESIHNRFPDLELLDCIIELSVLSELTKKAEKPIFTHNKITKIINVALQYVVEWNPDLKKQLTMFLRAPLEIGKISHTDPNLPPYAPLKYAEKDFERLRDAHNDYVNVIKKIDTPAINEVQLRAILLGYISKMETIGHAFEKQFEELLGSFELSSKYDVTEIFSINKKISRNTIYVTDSKAIRDSLSHGRYKIISLPNSWEIHFNNNKDGYNFNEKYSYDEFIRFLDNNHKLYISQLVILMLIAANSYLKKYLAK
jgi:hypothetical protein